MFYLLTFETIKVVFWKRLAAQAIDCALVFLVAVVVAVFFNPSSQLFSWILAWTYLAYSIPLDTYRDGTVGKLCMGLTIVRKEDSSKLLTSFYRNIFKLFISAFVFHLLFLIVRNGYSGLHNIVAKTKVVQRRVAPDA
jgi:uncharacterized RDD family membrane protein YckC